MIVRKKVLVTAAAVFIAAVGIAGSVYALSCAYPADVDVWELELVEVTSDGEDVKDLDEYEGFEFQLESHPYRGIRFVGNQVDTGHNYNFDFEPADLPEDLEDEHDEEQGGDQ